MHIQVATSVCGPVGVQGARPIVSGPTVVGFPDYVPLIVPDQSTHPVVVHTFQILVIPLPLWHF